MNLHYWLLFSGVGDREIPSASLNEPKCNSLHQCRVQKIIKCLRILSLGDLTRQQIFLGNAYPVLESSRAAVGDMGQLASDLISTEERVCWDVVMHSSHRWVAVHTGGRSLGEILDLRPYLSPLLGGNAYNSRVTHHAVRLHLHRSMNTFLHLSL